MTDLLQLVAVNPDADLVVRVGDVFEFAGHSEDWWMELWAPDRDLWAAEIADKVRDELSKLGIRTRILSNVVVEDADGVGTEYTITKLRLKVESLLVEPETFGIPDELLGDLETDELVIPTIGLPGVHVPELEVQEAGAGKLIVVAVAAIALAVTAVVTWDAVTHFASEDLGEAAVNVSEASKLVGFAILIGVAALAVIAFREGSTGVRAAVGST